jgi:23S rRNA (adenine2503-C2)-methyltransferase
MTNLPLSFRHSLPAICDFALPETASVHKSPDGNTHKFVLRLADGARVESVSMRTPRRLTFCISSQVGCALKCSFCATGLMGLKRNLKSHEIVAQVMAMGDFHGWQDDRFNIVYMGMGEPLANLPAVTESVRILHDERGLNLGARRVTVSTSGLVPQIRELTKLELQVGLAVSLHATTDELRDELVPVNKRWPIRELLDAAREYGHTVGRRVTLEYVLLGGVNDSMEDADRLAAFARELPSKVNIIPYNPVPGLAWKRPSQAAIDAFAERLYPRAPAVTVRQTQGGDIWAACGQLGGLSPDPE